MARRKMSADSAHEMASSESTSSSSFDEETVPVGRSGSIAAYFTELLRSRPDLLKKRENNEIFEIWLAAHPGETVVPKNVIQGLSNVKSKLRKLMKTRKPMRARSEEEAPSNGESYRPSRNGSRSLEELEHLIDNCLHLARGADRDDFEQIIQHLRYARNQVVHKLGL
jgi:hypothetical protein